MRRLIFIFSVLLAMTLFFVPPFAKAEEGRHSLGVEVGEVNLTENVGSTYGNALGLGAFFNYAASDWVEFELEYLGSHHTSNNINLTQSMVSITAQYDIDEFDIFTPYLRGGAELISHTQDFYNGGSGTVSASTNGFGLDVGAGAKFDVAAHLMLGLDFMYHGIFDVSYTPPATGVSQAAIQSYYTILLRLGYVFGSAK